MMGAIGFDLGVYAAYEPRAKVTNELEGPEKWWAL